MVCLKCLAKGSVQLYLDLDKQELVVMCQTCKSVEKQIGKIPEDKSIN